MMANPDLSSPCRAARPRPRAEFRFYFGLIFLFALPFALARWAVAFLGPAEEANPGVLHRALNEARAITPMIFSA